MLKIGDQVMWKGNFGASEPRTYGSPMCLRLSWRIRSPLTAMPLSL